MKTPPTDLQCHVDRAMEGGIVPSPLGNIVEYGTARFGPQSLPQEYRCFGRYAVTYIHRGEGRYMDANGITRRILPGDLIFLFPDLPHRYCPSGRSGWSESFWVFEGPLFDFWVACGLLEPRMPVIHLEPIEYWRGRFDTIVEEPLIRDAGSALLEVGRLQQVISEVFASSRRAAGQGDLAWVARAKAMLETDGPAQTSLSKIAEKLNVSYNTFRRRFTKAVGIQPGAYRSQYIVAKAQGLMIQGDLSDKQIALELGFADPAYFSRRFKQVTNQTPTQFRATIAASRHVNTANEAGKAKP